MLTSKERYANRNGLLRDCMLWWHKRVLFVVLRATLCVLKRLKVPFV